MFIYDFNNYSKRISSAYFNKQTNVELIRKSPKFGPVLPVITAFGPVLPVITAFGPVLPVITTFGPVLPGITAFALCCL